MWQGNRFWTGATSCDEPHSQSKSHTWCSQTHNRRRFLQYHSPCLERHLKFFGLLCVERRAAPMPTGQRAVARRDLAYASLSAEARAHVLPVCGSCSLPEMTEKFGEDGTLVATPGGRSRCTLSWLHAKGAMHCGTETRTTHDAVSTRGVSGGWSVRGCLLMSRHLQPQLLHTPQPKVNLGRLLLFDPC